MKMIKQYSKVCESCFGYGYIPEIGTSYSITRICPACFGSGTVIVTETIEDDGLKEIIKWQI